MDARLDRIEAKIDRLSEAVAAIVVLEERQANANETIREMQGRIAELQGQLASMNEKHAMHAGRNAMIERVLWFLLVVMLGAENSMPIFQKLLGQ